MKIKIFALPLIVLSIISCSNNDNSSSNNSGSHHENQNPNLTPNEIKVNKVLPSKNVLLSNNSYVQFTIENVGKNEIKNNQICLKIQGVINCNNQEKNVIIKNPVITNHNQQTSNKSNIGYIIINSKFLNKNLENGLSIIYDSTEIYNVNNHGFIFHNIRDIETTPKFSNNDAEEEIFFSLKPTNFKEYYKLLEKQNKDGDYVAQDNISTLISSNSNSVILEPEAGFTITKKNYADNNKESSPYNIKIKRHKGTKGDTSLVVKYASLDMVNYEIINPNRNLVEINTIKNIHNFTDLFVKEVILNKDESTTIKCNPYALDSSSSYSNADCNNLLFSNYNEKTNSYILGAVDLSNKAFKLDILDANSKVIKTIDLFFKTTDYPDGFKDVFNIVKVDNLVPQTNYKTIGKYDIIRMNDGNVIQLKILRTNHTLDEYLAYQKTSKIASNNKKDNNINIKKISNIVKNIIVRGNNKEVIYLKECENQGIVDVVNCEIKIEKLGANILARDGVEFEISTEALPNYLVEKDIHTVITSNNPILGDNHRILPYYTSNLDIYVLDGPIGEGYDIQCERLSSPVNSSYYSYDLCVKNLYRLINNESGEYVFGTSKVDPTFVDLPFAISLNRFGKKLFSHNIKFNTFVEYSDPLFNVYKGDSAYNINKIKPNEVISEPSNTVTVTVGFNKTVDRYIGKFNKDGNTLNIKDVYGDLQTVGDIRVPAHLTIIDNNNCVKNRLKEDCTFQIKTNKTSFNNEKIEIRALGNEYSFTFKIVNKQ